MRAPTDAEIEFTLLTSDTGRSLLASVQCVASPTPADVARWRKTASIEAVNAAIRLASARRRGAGKFHQAASMWLDPVGLEQATAEVVARHKAKRFSGAQVVDLCAGIGGDALAIAGSADSVLAVDLDQGMCRRLRWNAEVHGVRDRLFAVRADVTSFPIPANSLVHIDPDRRVDRTRPARAVEYYVPNTRFLRSLVASQPGGAIKLGPASDFASHFDLPGHEIEIISLKGECKEATIWFGRLATCRRRATVLPEAQSWTDDSTAESTCAPIDSPGAWVFDPDPALSRSGLVDSFAVAHGLARLAPGIDYLTGPDPIESPFLSRFQVLDSLPLDRKRLRRIVAEHELGPLEIKVRGIAILPEVLRDELRPQGSIPVTLLIYRDENSARVVVARRV
jgi:hypothetical protein